MHLCFIITVAKHGSVCRHALVFLSLLLRSTVQLLVLNGTYTLFIRVLFLNCISKWTSCFVLSSFLGSLNLSSLTLRTVLI